MVGSSGVNKSRVFYQRPRIRLLNSSGSMMLLGRVAQNLALKMEYRPNGVFALLDRGLWANSNIYNVRHDRNKISAI